MPGVKFMESNTNVVKGRGAESETAAFAPPNMNLAMDRDVSQRRE
jgi:hypothetical protein